MLEGSQAEHRRQRNAEETAEDAYRAKSRHVRKRLDRVRTRRKEGKSLPDNAIEGMVTTSAGPYWVVETAADPPLYLCTVSGTIDTPEADTIVTVGDNVWIVPQQEVTEYGHPVGVIVKREERQTLLSRRAAGRAHREHVVVANVDQLAIVVSARQPTYNKRLIDRYLIAADKGDLEPIIIVNKVDLVAADERAEMIEDFAAYWDDLGLSVAFVSASTGDHVEELKPLLIGRSTLLSGPSGVGKSSLINALATTRLRVGEISAMYQKGRHTTTAALVIPLPEGGQLVDSPGLREFSVWELDLEELPYYFAEFTAFAEHCRYQPCSHRHEPGCAVIAAVEEGKIDPERYLSYVILADELVHGDQRR